MKCFKANNISNGKNAQKLKKDHIIIKQQQKTIPKNNSNDNLNKIDNLNKNLMEKINQSLKQEEIYILTRIYNDLAQRNPDKLLHKEEFFLLFQFTGLIGQKLFSLFDKEHQHSITLTEFLFGICQFLLCSDNDKTRNLFQIFTLSNKDHIEKSEFQCLLQNYSKQALKTIFNDQQFIEKENILEKCGLVHNQSLYKNKSINLSKFQKQFSMENLQQNDQSSLKLDDQNELPQLHINNYLSVQPKVQTHQKPPIKQFSFISDESDQQENNNDYLIKQGQDQINFTEFLNNKINIEIFSIEQSNSSNEKELQKLEKLIINQTSQQNDLDLNEDDSIDIPYENPKREQQVQCQYLQKIKKKNDIDKLQQKYLLLDEEGSYDIDLYQDLCTTAQYCRKFQCNNSKIFQQQKDNSTIQNFTNLKLLNGKIESDGVITSPKMRKQKLEENSDSEIEKQIKSPTIFNETPFIDKNKYHYINQISNINPISMRQFNSLARIQDKMTIYSNSQYQQHLQCEKIIIDKEDQLSQATSFEFQTKNGNILLNNVNISAMLKLYVEYVFEEYDIDKQGKLNFIYFKNWSNQHPAILNMYSSMFIQEIWGYNNNIPLHENLKIKHQGYMYINLNEDQKKANKKWFEIKNKFLYQFNNQEEHKFQDIICLNGLVTNFLNDFESTHKYGFELYHNNYYYKQKQFYCDTLKEMKQWIAYLKILEKQNPEEKYIFKEILGRGLTSIVYHCQDKKNKHDYAIKVIEKFRLSAVDREALENETEVMKFLDHPGIIKNIEAFETKTSIYIVNELVKGGDLHDYVINKYHLQEYEAFKIFSQIVETVQYIHSTGIIHRDLKPENILLSFEESNLNGGEHKFKQIKIIDFGFAKFTHKLDPYPSQEYGTYGYIAPEVLNGDEATFLSDSFGLGVILYFMLSGKEPFFSQLLKDIISNTIKGIYKLSGKIWDKVSNEAKSLVQQLLVVDPNKRLNLQGIQKHPWIKKFQSNQKRQNNKNKSQFQNQISKQFIN